MAKIRQKDTNIKTSSDRMFKDSLSYNLICDIMRAVIVSGGEISYTTVDICSYADKSLKRYAKDILTDGYRLKDYEVSGLNILEYKNRVQTSGEKRSADNYISKDSLRIKYKSDDTTILRLSKKSLLKHEAEIKKLLGRGMEEYKGDCFKVYEEDKGILEESNLSTNRRKHRTGEIALAYLAHGNIRCLPCDWPTSTPLKLRIEEEDETFVPIFIPGYIVKGIQDRHNQKAGASQSNGALITRAGIYTIYNAHNTGLKKLSVIEEQIAAGMRVWTDTVMPWHKKYTEINGNYRALKDRADDFTERFRVCSAIIYIDKDEYPEFTARFFEEAPPRIHIGNKIIKNTSAIHKMTQIYPDGVMILPWGMDGMTFTDILTYPDWHYCLTSYMAVKHPNAGFVRETDAMRLQYNYYDGYIEDGTKVVSFLDFNISKIRRLFNKSLSKGSIGINERIVIHCYDFQVSLLKALFPVYGKNEWISTGIKTDKDGYPVQRGRYTLVTTTLDEVRDWYYSIPHPVNRNTW